MTSRRKDGALPNSTAQHSGAVPRIRLKRRKLQCNAALILGVVILLCIAAVMIWPELLAGRSPYERQRVRFTITDGKLEIDAAPFPPSRDFPLGSDDMGRDILSYIAYGTRMTMLIGFLVASGRFLLATPAALAAGSGSVVARGLLKQGNTLLSAIPALLVCVILLRLDFFGTLDKGASMAAFVIVLSLVGMPKLGILLAERVDAVYQQPFIRGEAAIGKRRIRILQENVLPHLVPELTVLFFMEIARALTILMQLGVFSVFIGNLKVIADTEGGVSFYNISFEPEWSSMLATSRTLINAAPWAVLFPALAFFVSVLGFNLFGEGLRHAMQQPDSQVIPRFRRLLMLNRRSLWNQGLPAPLKLGASGRRRISILMLVMTGAAAAAVLLTGPTQVWGTRSFQAYAGPALPAEPAVLGTPAAAEVAALIVEQMKALGIDPLYKEGYIRPYTVSPVCLVEDQQISLSLNGSDPLQLKQQRDFTFAAADDFTRAGLIYDASAEDILSDSGITRLSSLSDRFIMLDKQYYTDAALNWCMNAIAGTDSTSARKAAGFLLIARNDELLDRSIIPRSEAYPAIIISRELAERIRSVPDGSAALSVSVRVQPLGTIGRNIGGIYRGADQFIGDEAVIISLGYNYLDTERRDVLTFGLALMQNLCAGQKHKRSIIFLYSDGNLEPEYHGIVPTAVDFPYEAVKVQACLDLSGLSRSRFDELVFSSAQAPVTRQFAWSLARALAQDLERKGITLQTPAARYIGNEYYFTHDAADNAMFWEAGIATVIIEHPRLRFRDDAVFTTAKSAEERHTLEELGVVVMKHMESISY
jgi:peptide/nickel transport system permease protein